MSFLVFEGIDGSGKSTLIKAFNEELKKRSLESVVTREPGGTVLGQKIRSLLLEKNQHPPDPYTEILLYFADRNQHISEVIKPTLEKKQWLLSDRYWASTLAYQCGGRQLDESFIMDLCRSICVPSCEPDLWVLLDLPVENSMERLENSREGEKDRLESEAKSFHQRVRDYYLKMSQKQPHSWLVLDALQSQEELLKQLLSSLRDKKLLKEHL